MRGFEKISFAEFRKAFGDDQELYQEYRKYNLFGKLLYAVEIPYNSYDPYDFISYYYVLKYTNGKNKYLYIDGSIIDIEPNQEKLKKLTNEFLNELIKKLTVNNINIIYKELEKHKDD